MAAAFEKIIFSQHNSITCIQKPEAQFHKKSLSGCKRNRIETRLLEQGAIHAVLVVETPDGITVRLLEDLITEELGIGQAISIRKKIDGLLNPLVRDSLQKELKILLGKVKDCILTSGITEITEIATTWDYEYSTET